ncbi:glucosyltransferase domain-containing protein [Pseudomonas congelans]|uniref:glucosyltransferase domain-containing protein n=1 Tax=Pseudomonas congelans TaxID=200452 RepID=UPI000BB5B76C|nr:glucosyltransferase domain-containing protein [Pseudomonas congelans]PBP98182.1 hypothetical protein CCL24_10355 [Pseudomonas congelans]
MLNNKINAVLLKTFIFLLLTGCIWLSPLCTPTLEFTVTSDTASQSQLYTSSNAIFSETGSETQPLTVGKNDLRFSLLNAASPARWDPTQSAADIKVSGIRVTVAGIRVPGTRIDIQPLNQITSVTKAPDEYALSMAADANDPQVLVQFDDSNIALARLVICMTLSCFIFLLVTGGKIADRVQNKYALGINRKILDLKTHIAKQQFSKKEFFILLFLSTLLNSYFITNLSLSIDDEMGALRTNPEVWISQGRWAVYLIERFLLPLPAIPFLPYLILDVALTLSYMLMTRIHGGVPSWKSYLTFPVFCSFPTWWLISEFSSNVPAVAMGLFLTVLSASISTPVDTVKNNKNSKFKTLAICSMLAIAIASYQSLILLYLTMGLGIMLTRTLSTPQSMNYWVLRNGVRYLFLAAGGMAIYYLLNKIFQDISGSYSAYLNNFLNLDRIIENPLSAFRQIVSEAGRVYFGSPYYFGASIGLAPLILLVSTLTTLNTAAAKNKLITIFIWLLVLATPFLLHVLAGANGVPMRTMISLAYVAWLMTFVLLTTAQGFSAAVCAPLVIVYSMQLLNLNSQYIASATLTQKHDELLAADIYRKIGEIDKDFSADSPVKIDFYGHKKFETIYAKAWTSTMQASFFDWDNGNISRILSYLKIQGYPNLYAADDNTRKTLKPVFMSMPAWPAPGSVIKINDTYLVKLGNEADPAHY